MKLVVVGATGLVGPEIIRQALAHKAITSVVALGRRPTNPPPSDSVPRPGSASASVPKFQSVTYAAVRRRCLLIAVAPAAYQSMDWELVKTIILDYVMNGFKILSRLHREAETAGTGTGKPLRFIYASGCMTERDQTAKPKLFLFGDYMLLRGLTETKLLDAIKDSAGAVETCIMRIGHVNSPSSSLSTFLSKTLARLRAAAIGLPVIDNREIAAAAIRAAVRGFDKDTLENDELVSMGRQELEENGSA